MKKFFKERLLELLHKNTLDSYRVKVNNSNTLFHELQNLIIDWNDGKIKRFETLKLSAEELLYFLKDDDCISYGKFHKEVVIQILKDFIKSDVNTKKGEHDYTLYILSVLIIKNENAYLNCLFSKIDSLIIQDANQQNFVLFDRYLNSLIAELIRVGYAKSYLYIISKYAFNSGNFDENYRRYKETLLNRHFDFYHIFFKLTFEDVSIIPERDNLLREIPEEIVNDPASLNFEPQENIRYFYIKENALDAHTALRKSKLSLSTFLDKIHISLGLSQVELGKMSIVKKESNTRTYLTNNEYVVDGVYKDGSSFIDVDATLSKVIESTAVYMDVKERINSALRHFRLGNCASDLEQKFINYWIGLEFIFSVPEKDISTFARIKEHLPVVLSCGYIKRNLTSIDNMFVVEKESSGLGDKKLWDFEASDFTNIEHFVESSLKKYRLSKVKSLILGATEKRSEYLKNHEKFVKWHLVRLYRLRNELIHDAAIKNNIVQVTSDLRYYLAYILNQLLMFFSALECDNVKSEYSINDFFYEYSIVRKNIEKDFSVDVIFSVAVEFDLIK